MDKNTEIYIYIDNKQEGPFSLDDIMHIGIDPNTLVWFQGQPNWVKASEVPQLNALIEQFTITPPVPQVPVVPQPSVPQMPSVPQDPAMGNTYPPIDSMPYQQMQAPPAGMQYQTDNRGTGTKKSKMGLIIAAAALLVVALVGAGIYYTTTHCSTYITHEEDDDYASDLSDEGAEEQFQKGLSHYEQEDYDQAVEWFRKAAEQGHARAQSYMGVCYNNGEGVEKDYERAAYWFRKAAEQGVDGAQCNLAHLYREGNGVEQDMNQAIYWYKMAAEQGNTAAKEWLEELEGENDENSLTDNPTDAEEQFQLGYCYYMGEGVPMDNTKAMHWFLKAAEQGHDTAMYYIGECYYNGYGVDEDLSQATYWYQKAARLGNSRAQSSLRNMNESW